LALLADHLVEIHGQAANHQIVKPARQRELLDRFIGGDLSKALQQYQENFNGFNELKARIKAMRESVSKRDSQIAELQEFSSAWIKLKAVRGEVASTNDQISLDFQALKICELRQMVQPRPLLMKRRALLLHWALRGDSLIWQKVKMES
jgi:hypothetical protein